MEEAGGSNPPEPTNFVPNNSVRHKFVREGGFEPCQSQARNGRAKRGHTRNVWVRFKSVRTHTMFEVFGR